jgi:hypothetical protein
MLDSWQQHLPNEYQDLVVEPVVFECLIEHSVNSFSDQVGR